MDDSCSAIEDWVVVREEERGRDGERGGGGGEKWDGERWSEGWG